MKDAPNKPFVSVVVPVYNDEARLVKCLAALEGQDYPETLYEVLVVDNGSSSDLQNCVAPFPHVRLTVETTPGSYAARNKGILLSRGRILAFTDSDTIPYSDWISNGVAALLATPQCGLVGGRILMFFRDPDHPTGAELYDLVCGFPQESFVKSSKFAATANVFTFREVLDGVGFFNPKLRSGGDMEWSHRVFRAGYQLSYCDAACVSHPARYSLKELYDKTLRVTSGHKDISLIEGSVSLPRTMMGILVDIIPPVKRLHWVCSSRKLKGIDQRVKAGIIVVAVRYARAWIRFKLLFHPPFQIR